MNRKQEKTVKKQTNNVTELTRAQSADGVNREVDSNWSRLIRRRKFLQGIGAAGAALPAASLFGATATTTTNKLHPGDAALLQLALTIELLEADLWQQYNELGGAVDRNDQPNPGNPAYIAALQNLDGDMPQYISDNTDDEISHAAFLTAYLKSKGETPVDLTQFQILPGSQATGANKDARRLTNLTSLNVDTSWYFRYRSTQNPDLGANFPQLLNIKNQPAIPLSDTDTNPNTLVPIPPGKPGPNRMQAIANTAGFHFAYIEQGGSSLYPILALKATSREALRILLSIGGVEIDHFSLWHDKGANAVAQPLAGVSDPMTGLTFPDFNNPANQHNNQLSKADQAAGGQMFQTNLILPEPTQFLSASLPPVSIIRPTLDENGGALATIQSFIADNLFMGQGNAFLELLFELAAKADAVQPEDRR
jgi:Ferritin-like domain